jgi:hypothetical protein
MDIQKGEYVKMTLEKDRLIVKKVIIVWLFVVFG